MNQLPIEIFGIIIKFLICKDIFRGVGCICQRWTCYIQKMHI